MNTNLLKWMKTLNQSLRMERFQKKNKFFHPKATGKLEYDTTEVKNAPRCGFSDVFNPETHGWRKNKLAYRILNDTPDMPTSKVDEVIEKAFKVWSNVVPLTFTRVHDNTSDIDISFIKHTYNNHYPFEGPGNILGNAFLPGNLIGGNIHFYDNTTWTYDQTDYNLFSMAVHLLGHSLGLLHSNNSKALMFPTYKFISSQTFHLPEEDQERIQRIYGTQLVPRSQKLRKLPDCTLNITFDAVTTMASEMLFFKDKHVWRQINKSVHENTTIESLFPGVPSNIQAAYEYRETQIIIIFKDSQYWNLTQYVPTQDSPKDISEMGFSASVQKIDAAVHDQSSHKTYFFVDEQYWSYDEKTQKLDSDCPEDISDGFPDIGEKVDAAYQRDGLLYFLNGQTQYEFNVATQKAVISSENLHPDHLNGEGSHCKKLS